MSWPAFSVRVPGKWVLAGEHSVLRGSQAVALPHPDFHLELNFTPHTGGLVVHPEWAETPVLDLLKTLGVNELPAGRLELVSTIPQGAGLGSSAAFSVAITRWAAPALDLPPSKWFETARGLENRFHGKSSGMDIAAVLAMGPVQFKMGEAPRTLDVKSLPQFKFFDTGLRAGTRMCIERVEAANLGSRWDSLMNEAAELGVRGLSAYSEGDQTGGRQLIVESFARSNECYRQGWDLWPESAIQLGERLMSDGARAVRMTGAGMGGFLVALVG